MSLLQVMFIVSSVVLVIIAVDIAQKQRFSALHFLIFTCIGLGLLVCTLFPDILETLGRLFGVQRGADVLVYSSILFLMHFVLLLLNKVEKNREDLTKLVRAQALLEYRLTRTHEG